MKYSYYNKKVSLESNMKLFYDFYYVNRANALAKW